MHFISCCRFFIGHQHKTNGFKLYEHSTSLIDIEFIIKLGLNDIMKIEFNWNK